MMDKLFEYPPFDRLDSDAKFFTKSIIIATIGLLFFIILTGYIFNDFMNTFVGNLAYPMSASVVSFGFITLLIYQTELKNIVQIRFLLTFFTSISLFTFFQIFNWDVAVRETPFQRPLGYPLLNIADLFIVISIIALYYHFESIRDGDPNFPMIWLISLFSVPYFILSFLVIFFGNAEANHLLSDLLPFFALSVFAITIYGINTMIRIFITTKSKSNKRNALYVVYALFYMVFSFITQILSRDYMSFGFFDAELYQLAILSISVLVIAGVYLRDPQFLFITTSRIDQFFIIDSEDSIIWAYQQWPPKYYADELETTSKVLSTASNLLGQVTSDSVTVREIKFSLTGSIIIEKVDNLSLIFVIENNSRYLNLAISRFISRLQKNKHILNEEKIIDEIKEHFIDTFQII